MTEREIAELRRRFRPDRSAITHVHGCYVNENREIVARFDQSIALMTQEESESLLAILKRTLSGTLGKNLLDIEFTTRQVAEGGEHGLLMALRDSGLKDQEAVEAFFQKAIGALNLEGNYMILLAHDTYDVPYKAKDGQEQEDASGEVYSYLLCSVCPVKPTKPALSYSAHENEFHRLRQDWVVSPPELGFLFPAFDDRSANLYNALYYNRDPGENYPDFVEAVFRTPVPMPAAAQKETFQSVLGEALSDDCSYGVVQAVHDQLCGLIADHKANKEEEPLVITKGAVKCVLRAAGVSDSRMNAFDAGYDEAFGEGTALSPRNLVDTSRMEVRTPDVTIKVNPERSDLVATRVINGVKYILIRADEGVEVDGVNIHIT